MNTDTFYHIYNHANGNENLFRTDDNYLYFLKRFAHFINPVADTFAYCLMPNHFHFLIRVKEVALIEETFGKFETFQKLESRITKQFANFFSSYTQSYNKVFNRRGSLFNPNFKHKEVDNDIYYTKLIHYIHANPVHHGFVNTIEDWPFSSYHAFLSNKDTLLKRKDVLEWFNGIDEFITFHKQPIDPKMYLDFD